MLTTSGAKLLDFGLAKLRQPTLVTGFPLAATVTAAPVTSQGTILGTLQYMSPEQLQGQEADARSDIWSFGCVVYEMLTGTSAFAGDSAATIISAVIRDTPKPVTTFTTVVPPTLDHVIARCLEKQPNARWQSVRDVAAELRWVASTARQAALTNQPRRRWGSLWTVVAASLILGFLGGVVAFRMTQKPAAGRPLWFDLRPVDGNTIGSGRGAPQIAVSPDGDKLAYSAIGVDGIRHLWVHRFSARTPQLLSATDRAIYPFWAPDNRWVAFGVNGKLMKVDTVSGTVQAIGDVPAFGGGTWNADDVIVFSTGRPRRLYRVAASGGTPQQVAVAPDFTDLDEQARPQFLPDGRHLIFHSGGPKHAIYVADVNSATAPKKIRDTEAAAVYASGYLLFAQGNTLLAQAFDVRTLAVTGQPMLIAPGVDTTEAAYTASPEGVLVFRPPARGEVTQLTWFNRRGQEEGIVGGRAGYQALSLADTQSRIATEITNLRSGDTDIWIIDAKRAITSRLTFTSGPEEMPVWAADATRVAFASHRTNNAGSIRIMIAAVDSGATHVVKENGGHIYDWSPDGRYILSVPNEGVPGEKLVAMPTVAGGEEITVVSDPVIHDAQFSPNGQWIAYSSDKSGRSEVYVTSFPSGRGRWQVSSNGGSQPRWVKKTNELIYLAADSKLMAVETRNGATFESGVPSPLFEIRVDPSVNRRTQYVVSNDGQRFLVNMLTGELGSQSPTTVVLNWTAALKK
jgi:Tol biopolymer transport system component